MQAYKVFIESAHLGCLPNLIGCSIIYRYMKKNGHEIIKNSSKADFIIINSCGFSEEIQNICIGLFEKYYSLKKKNAAIIMFGCLVKINKERLHPLDLFLISQDEGYKFDKLFYSKIKFNDINPYCDEETKEKLTIEKKYFIFWRNIPFIIIKTLALFSKKARLNFKALRDGAAYKNRFFVEISRGCIGNCSYCTIKKAKGTIQSRNINDIISDIEKIYDPSKNLFLVADDCGCYGLDKDSNLIELIYKINDNFSAISIDLNYLNPFLLEKKSEKYIQLFSNVKIDLVIIPMQSGSDKILKSMNRYYKVENVIKIIDKIKKISPNTIMYAHFIIGYPGETTKDFIKTLSAVKHFDYPVAFRYSNVKGTVSSSLPYQKSNLVINLRWFVFLLVINFVIFYRMTTRPILSHKL